MKKLKIVYEDKKILVVDKEAGLLTIGTEKERYNTLYHLAREYVKKQYPKNKIFIVHRLDKDTSGLVLFAKSEDVKRELQNNWAKVVRKYYCIVEGVPSKDEDTIIVYLKENNRLEVIPSLDSKNGKKSVTKYKVLKTNNKCSLLEITIVTGRKNQIRASLAFIGHPIIGDKKYGSKINPLNRLALQAYYLGYDDNIFKIDIHKEFDRLF